MARRPIGVVSRHPVDFSVRKAMGGVLQVAASGGNLGHVELFNNSAQGLYLYVWGLNAAASVTTQFTLEGYSGQKGTLVDSLSTAPLLIGGPLLPGIIKGFYSAACVGQHFGQASASLGGQWSPNAYPICVIPPGYSACQECQSAGVIVVCAFVWTVDDQP